MKTSLLDKLYFLNWSIRDSLHAVSVGYRDYDALLEFSERAYEFETTRKPKTF